MQGGSERKRERGNTVIPRSATLIKEAEERERMQSGGRIEKWSDEGREKRLTENDWLLFLRRVNG